jgi:hypothetical protein
MQARVRVFAVFLCSIRTRKSAARGSLLWERSRGVGLASQLLCSCTLAFAVMSRCAARWYRLPLSGRSRWSLQDGTFETARGV